VILGYKSHSIRDHILFPNYSESLQTSPDLCFNCLVSSTSVQANELLLLSPPQAVLVSRFVGAHARIFVLPRLLHVLKCGPSSPIGTDPAGSHSHSLHSESTLSSLPGDYDSTPAASHHRLAYIKTDDKSTRQSCCSCPIWGQDHIFDTQLRFCRCEAPSLTRGQVCHLSRSYSAVHDLVDIRHSHMSIVRHFVYIKRKKVKLSL
jgi:hypothetical protein